MTFKFYKLDTMPSLSLADASIGCRVTITGVDLESEAQAWLGAVGLHVGEKLVVLRRAALGGPLHVRTGGGGEFAVAREVARHIAVTGSADEQSEAP